MMSYGFNRRRSADSSVLRAGALLSMFALLLNAGAVYAQNNAPACAPSSLKLLGPASTATLVELTPDAQAPRLSMRFVNPTPELLALNPFDDVLLVPGAGLPTGFQGQVWNVSPAGNELTLIVEGSRLAGSATLPITPVATTDPDDFTGPRECFTLLEDASLTGDDDGGLLEEQCSATNGNDFGFSLELVEGVEINGLITASPFDIDGKLEIDALNITEARVVSEGRLSFAGEISATADAVIPEGVVSVGSAILGRYQLKLGELNNIANMTATLYVDTFVGACGSISAGARTGLATTAAATLGVEWENGAPRVIASTAQPDLTISPPELDSDVSADVTLYGGAVLRLELDLDVAGIVPIAGVATEMTARGSVRTQVDPAADPWWRVSGRPEIYVDLYPQLLTGDLTRFDFNVINPPEQEFFSATSEFPFNPPSAAANRSTGTREAGTALRWSRAFQSDTFYQTVDTVPLQDGGALALANSAQFGLILRTDYLGNRVWQRRVEGAFVVDSAWELANANLLVAGRMDGDLWLMLLDADGALQWSREYGTAVGNINSVRITGTQGNDILLAGRFTTTTGVPEFDPWAARISAGGAVVWANHYGQAVLDEQVLGATGLNDGGLMLVGDTDFTPAGPLLPGSNTYTLRLNADGTVRWSNVWASSTGDQLSAATQAPDGSFITVGSTGGTNQDAAPRGLIIRYDEDTVTAPTEPRYVRSFGGALTYNEFVFDEFVDVVNTGNGFTLAGMGGLSNERRLWLAGLAERGNEPDLTWSAFHDGLDEDTLVRMHNVGDGFLLGGNSRSFTSGALTEALWLTRLPYDGWMGWNMGSNAQATYTPILEDDPPSFPVVSDALNVTGVEDTTALEQEIPLGMTAANSTELVLVPTGFQSVELVKAPLLFVDSDGDGVGDEVDNCTQIANADQRDTNSDGYGNSCDPDVNDDGAVNFIDLSIMSGLFLMADDDADLNGDGVVNFIDISTLAQYFLLPPGPSGIAP